MEPTADNRLSSRLICPCNNKEYSSYASLKQHYKTQGHQLWESNKMIRDLKTDGTRIQNENMYLKNTNVVLSERNEVLEKENRELIEKMKILEKNMGFMNIFNLK
jgi:hypothetical protein